MSQCIISDAVNLSSEGTESVKQYEMRYERKYNVGKFLNYYVRL